MPLRCWRSRSSLGQRCRRLRLRRRRCSVIGGYVQRGRYVFGDYCSGRIWTAPFANGRIGTVRALPFRIPRLTTFGRTAPVTLYAGTAGGILFRLR